MCVGSPTARTLSISPSPPDNEFETDRRQTSHFRGGVHRLHAGKTSHFRDGIHRLCPRDPGAYACAVRQHVRPYRELSGEALGRGRKAVAIWQDRVDNHGFSAGYTSVRRFVLKLRGAALAEARVVIMTAAGEAYGETGVMVSSAAIATPIGSRRAGRCLPSGAS